MPIDRTAHQVSFATPAGATAPIFLKWLLCWEDPIARTVWIGRAIPRVWLSEGETVAVDGATTVVTMLPSSPHVEAVYTGKDGVFETMGDGTVCIDSSTIDPAMSQKVAALTIQRGGSFVDAPVSGGVGGAEAGTLTFMVGGSEEHFATSKLVMDLMGANVVHCGDVGTGQVAKLCNNMMLGISMIGASETMNMGVK